MKRSYLAPAALLVLACASEPPVEPSAEGGYPPAPNDREHAANPAPGFGGKADGYQANKVIFIGGICSTQFDSPDSPLGRWEGKQSIDAKLDQRFNMGTPVVQLKETFDRECTGEDWCAVHAYSNGGAVLSKTLSVFDATQWNILWVNTVASNEGGSELSSSWTVAALTAVGLADCELVTSVSPTEHRAGWNHNDTGNHSLYMFAGKEQWWSTGSEAYDFFSDMANDGVVAFHSAAGMNDTFNVPEDDPWMCFRETRHFANHKPTGDCTGVPLEHEGMKLHGLPKSGKQ